MLICPNCKTNNLEGSQYCDECGNQLKPLPNEGNQIKQVELIEHSSPIQMASVTSVGIPLLIEDKKDSNFLTASTPNNSIDGKKISAKLVIERGVSIGTEFAINSNVSYIGRWDADNGVFPDVDLDAFDPEAKVSRRHAKISCHDGQYAIEDLGSTNGTYINRGRRLIPGNPHILTDGDEIIVGKTFLRFKIL